MNANYMHLIRDKTSTTPFTNKKKEMCIKQDKKIESIKQAMMGEQNNITLARV